MHRSSTSRILLPSINHLSVANVIQSHVVEMKKEENVHVEMLTARFIPSGHMCVYGNVVPVGRELEPGPRGPSGPR